MGAVWEVAGLARPATHIFLVMASVQEGGVFLSWFSVVVVMVGGDLSLFFVVVCLFFVFYFSGGVLCFVSPMLVSFLLFFKRGHPSSHFRTQLCRVGRFLSGVEHKEHCRGVVAAFEVRYVRRPAFLLYFPVSSTITVPLTPFTPPRPRQGSRLLVGEESNEGYRGDRAWGLDRRRGWGRHAGTKTRASCVDAALVLDVEGVELDTILTSNKKHE